jgi:hypothetical protein
MTIIDFLKNKENYQNSNYSGKNVIILVMDDRFRKNGQNIRAFLKDYFEP